MENKYETKSTTMGTVLVSKNGNPFVYVNESDLSTVLAAFKLYDSVYEHLAENLGLSPTKSKFTDYIGIDSDWIVKLGYNYTTNEMKVAKSDAEYIYKDVPAEVFKSVLNPSEEFQGSVGKAYNSLVKGKYQLGG
jgi:hypothetical protein